MSVNDKEIDVLLRRYAKGPVTSHGSSEHLDADELNAFAEGALPAAARQRYVSHLVDCDDCRKLASQLVIAAGSAVEARFPASEAAAESWWRKVGALFSPLALRYAAFAVLLVAVVGVSVLVWRRPTPPNADLIAQKQPETTPAEATKPAAPKASTITTESNAEDQAARGAPQPTPLPEAKHAETGAVTAAPPPPPKSESEADKPALAARAAEAPRVVASPSYAPAPPAETYRVEDRAREQQNAGEPLPSGARRGDYDKYKTMDRTRAGEFAKQRDQEQKSVANQPVANENKDDATVRARPSSAAADVRGRSLQEARTETKKSETADEANETRSVGGRKFKRQGNAWVDSKFKSSMSVRNIARASEEFEKLDSGLRSIAQQLNGEIVVVWKGKAYRIR